MTGPNHIMHHQYVAAYQAAVKEDMHAARLGDSPLRVAYLRATGWLIEARVRFTTTKRSRVASSGVRSFDRSSTTGACEIDNGFAV